MPLTPDMKAALERIRAEMDAMANAPATDEELGPYYSGVANWDLLPRHMHGAMTRYVMDGMPPGSFLEAVMANDLMRAAMCADGVNKSKLPEYVWFVSEHTPHDCHGSYAALSEWIERGGLNGIQARPDGG